eukprot:Opistho-1_new@98993
MVVPSPTPTVPSEQYRRTIISVWPFMVAIDSWCGRIVGRSSSRVSTRSTTAEPARDSGRGVCCMVWIGPRSPETIQHQIGLIQYPAGIVVIFSQSNQRLADQPSAHLWFTLMDIRQLKYFVAVADARNFTRASEVLHIAQPPLSRQIQLLEEELGVQLILRNSRPLRLTEAGRTAWSLSRLSTWSAKLGRGSLG